MPVLLRVAPGIDSVAADQAHQSQVFIQGKPGQTEKSQKYQSGHQGRLQRAGKASSRTEGVQSPDDFFAVFRCTIIKTEVLVLVLASKHPAIANWKAKKSGLGQLCAATIM